MSTATLFRSTPAPDLRPLRPRSRPARRPVSLRGPVARPGRTVPAPTTRPGQRPVARSCRVHPADGVAAWRLTDRGIAVVLVLSAMIVVAALTVIGLTAWQVTGPDQPGWSAAVSSR